MKGTALISPEISATANALRCRVDGEWPAIVRRGETLFPAQQQFTIIDPAAPAHGATFTVPLPDLTPDTLRAKCAEIAASFAA